MPNFVDKNGNIILNLNHSTEESFTGKYWIDGKKIFRKTLMLNKQSSSHDLKFSKIIDVKAIVYSNSTYGYINCSNDIVIQTTSIYLMGTAANNVSNGIIATIYYTKV